MAGAWYEHAAPRPVGPERERDECEQHERGEDHNVTARKLAASVAASFTFESGPLGEFSPSW